MSGVGVPSNCGTRTAAVASRRKPESTLTGSPQIPASADVAGGVEVVEGGEFTKRMCRSCTASVRGVLN